MMNQLAKIETAIRITASLLEEAIVNNDQTKTTWLKSHLEELNALKLTLIR